MPVIILPGIDGVAELRDEVAGCLSQKRPVSVVAIPVDGSRYDVLADQIIALLPPHPFVLLGESFSGPLAIEIAARAPERVAGLVLAATFARNPWPRFLAAGTGLFDHRRLPRFILEAALFGATGNPDVRQRLHDLLRDVPPKLIAERAAAALTADMRVRLRDLACPILCLHGRRDWLIRPGLAREIKAVQPRTELCWLDAAHMLLETHPKAVAVEIERFCRGIAQAQSATS